MSIPQNFPRTVSIVVLALAFLQPRTAQADAVTDWNELANTVLLNVARGNVPSIIDLAYVHVAIYDAVNAIDRHHSVFAVVPRSPTHEASREAAAAAAAYTVLKSLFPTQQAYLDTVYSNYLLSLNTGIARGVAVGTEVATTLLALRAGDGRNANVPYDFLPPGAGVYQITPGAPPPPATPAAPWIAKMKPFAIESPSQFRAYGPPNLTSAQWAADFNETKQFGALNGSRRTPEQTEIGLFFTEAAATQGSRSLRLFVAAQEHWSVADSARLFAQVYVTAADSDISCWDSKYYYNFWRPVTAIRTADIDGNDVTQQDPDWLPLVVTPNHPEYPAAHGCGTGALAYALEEFFGTRKVKFTLTSTAVPGVALAEHPFTNTRDIVKEVINARVYGGMHYRSSVVHGSLIARHVARWVSQRYFRPVR
jgi:PAP2 superfamily protein